MAGTDNLLFMIDTIVADGVALPFESASGTISGAARFANNVVLAASGDDFNMRSRVPTIMRCKILFGPSVSVPQLVGLNGVLVTARDTQSGRRALMTNCTFGELGEIGAGSTDLVLNILSPIQWL